MATTTSTTRDSSSFPASRTIFHTPSARLREWMACLESVPRCQLLRRSLDINCRLRRHLCPRSDRIGWSQTGRTHTLRGGGGPQTLVARLQPAKHGWGRGCLWGLTRSRISPAITRALALKEFATLPREHLADSGQMKHRCGSDEVRHPSQTSAAEVLCFSTVRS